MKENHWIKSISSYVKDYMQLHQKESEFDPGEHFFVAMYLLPRIMEIVNTRNLGLPRYVNPDGGKDKMGDIVWPSQHSIEVKYGGAFKFTATQAKKFLKGGESLDRQYLLHVHRERMLFMKMSIFVDEINKMTDGSFFRGIPPGGYTKTVNKKMLNKLEQLQFQAPDFILNPLSGVGEDVEIQFVSSLNMFIASFSEHNKLAA